MSILADMLAELERERGSGKRQLPGLPAGRLVFEVGAWDAFCADMIRTGAGYSIDQHRRQAEAFGVPVVPGSVVGFRLVRRPA